MSVLDRFRATSPARQLLLLGVGVVVIGALLAGGYFGVIRKPYVVLYDDLRPAEAAAVVAALDARKEPYRLAAGGATVLTPADRADALRLALAGEELPVKGGVGFELFNKSDMGLTEFAQRINYQRALQGELARTLTSLDEIESARVHLALPEASVFRGDRRPPKASVSLQTRSGRPLSPATVEGVQQLIAAAVPELQASSVVVLDARGRMVGAPTAGAVDLPVVGPLADRERRLREAMSRAGYPPESVSLQRAPSVSGFEDSENPRLVAAVTVAAALTDGERDALQDLAAEALGADQAHLVTVTGMAPPPLPAAVPQAESLDDLAPEPVGDAPAEPKLALGWLIGGGVAAAMLVLLLLARLERTRRPRRLSDDQKRSFQAQLQQMLAQEAEHAPSA